MAQIIGEYGLLGFISIVGIVTIVNGSSYRKESLWLQLSGWLNVSCLLIGWLSFFLLRSLFSDIIAVLAGIIWLAALEHGWGMGRIHWQHHVARLAVLLILVSLAID